MQGACERKSPFASQGAFEMLRKFCFNLFDRFHLQCRSPLRAGLVPVLNRINRYAGLSGLCESMSPSMGFMCALQPGVADTKPSMRTGTSE